MMMIFFNLLMVLPQMFTVGADIAACLDGRCTKEEWEKTVDDIVDLAENIPEIKAFIIMNQGLFALAKLAFPLLDQLQESSPDTRTKLMASLSPEVLHQIETFVKAKAELPDGQLKQTKYSVKLMNDAFTKIAAKEPNKYKTKVDFSDDQSHVKYWDGEFDTGTFFDNQNNG
jgi:hypothetical protein